jgi:MFS family permease
MFLQYAPAGAVIPLFSLRLYGLGFSSLEIAAACATQPLATLLAPVVAGQVADRWWPAERLLAVCGLLSGIALWFLARLTDPAAVFGVALLFWLLLAPAMTLGTALCFAQLPNPGRDYSAVRLWGTVGWVAACWVVGCWLMPPGSWGLGESPAWSPSGLGDAFRVGGLFAFALGAYALTLPHTPPARTFQGRVAPWAAVKAMRSRAMAVYWLCVGGVCVTMAFTSQVTPLLLRALGYLDSQIAWLLTISQATEVAALAALPMLLTRLGIKGTLGLGLGAWAAALALLSVGTPRGLVVGSLTLNGLCICCFFVAGQVFVNSRARPDVRASAQALIHFMIGFGMLGGHLLVGWARRQFEGAFRPTFLVAAVIAAGLGMAFLVGFPADEQEMAQDR